MPQLLRDNPDVEAFLPELGRVGVAQAVGVDVLGDHCLGGELSYPLFEARTIDGTFQIPPKRFSKYSVAGSCADGIAQRHLLEREQGVGSRLDSHSSRSDLLKPLTFDQVSQYPRVQVFLPASVRTELVVSFPR